jgi:outer membrane protein
MKNISTLLSVVALIAVGVLYYLHFNTRQDSRKPATSNVRPDSTGFKIAYFDIDSLQTHYEYFKDVSSQIKAKESSITTELTNLQNSYQKKIREWQQKGPTMSQSEGEAAQREYAQMQQRYEQRQVMLEQELQKQKMEMMTDVRKRIEDYLRDFNQEKGYAFILSYEPGFMLYYKDSVYDITNDVIAGLNASYKSKSKN